MLPVLIFRWHNHLNPAINKEAWTQEEELALVRAHQIYGNKWAELTKFLPGRYVHPLLKERKYFASFLSSENYVVYIFLSAWSVVLLICNIVN